MPGPALSPDEGRTQQYKAMYEGMCHATKYLVIIAAAKWPSAVPIVHHTARRDAARQRRRFPHRLHCRQDEEEE